MSKEKPKTEKPKTEKPKNVAASVRDRLAAFARKRGEEFQVVLTRYVIE